jgi:hypothetical protein
LIELRDRLLSNCTFPVLSPIGNFLGTAEEQESHHEHDSHVDEFSTGYCVFGNMKTRFVAIRHLPVAVDFFHEPNGLRQVIAEKLAGGPPNGPERIDPETRIDNGARPNDSRSDCPVRIFEH